MTILIPSTHIIYVIYGYAYADLFFSPIMDPSFLFCMPGKFYFFEMFLGIGFFFFGRGYDPLHIL